MGDLIGIGELDAHRATIFLRRAVGRVVHLEHELPASRNQLGHPGRQNVGPSAGREPTQLAKRSLAPSAAATTSPPSTLWGALAALFCGDFFFFLTVFRFAFFG